MSFTITTISGNLTKDAEIHEGANGYIWASFTVAVDTFVKEGDKYVKKPSYYDCTWSGGLLQFVKDELLKGSKVAATGKHVQRDYTTKDGEKRRTWTLRIDDLDVIKKAEQTTDAIADDDIPF